jgi:NAD(P)-dependent dehydrogenase (short-subunit alcohol dehydrogenase family)
MEIRFDGKRALVTGAGKGIGREIAGCLARCGASVVAVSRTESDLLALREEIDCEIIVADLSDAGAVNVRALLVVSQVVAAGMILRGQGGAIVNLSSQASLAGLFDHAAYCASKGAVDALTRVMAQELGPHGIRVNGVNPTVTLTPMGEMAWSDPRKSGPMLAKIPLGHFAQPSDVADAVAYLLSDHAAMIHGVALPIDGGYLTA